MKKERRKTTSNVLKFIKIFVIALCIVLSLGVLVLIAAITGIIDTTANLNLESFQLKLTSQIYYIDPETNKEIEYAGLYAEENRQWVDIDEIPQIMQDAIISIEDERFYEHKGVDLLSTGKAAVLHAMGKETRGASTITQQLVKNLTKDDDISVKRKAVEILRAFNVERKLTKKQILEMYLNTIYLSNGCNGVAAAADYFFGKEISEITLAEAALIAGITQYPSLYDPVNNFENSKSKQEVVLAKMYELGKISKSEYTKAKNEELTILTGEESNVGSSVNSYFTDMIIDDVIDNLVEKKGYSEAAATALLFNGGLKIYSTMDPKVQNILENYFEDTSNFPLSGQETPPQSAMVVMDPSNGEIKGVVGGVGKKEGRRTLNRATQSLRQPGSTMKPIGVYAPGIEKGVITTGTTVIDRPININGWRPKNAGSYNGPVTISGAVAHSLNSVAVQVLQQVGLEYSYDFLTEKLGISTLVKSKKGAKGEITDVNYSSLALGGVTDGISPLEMTAAYAAFANNGIYNVPHSFSKVLTHNDEVLLQFTGKDKHRAMSKNTAYSMVSLLRGPVRYGTGTAANFRGDMDICGKTGTTDRDMDRWFIGFTPYYVAASWFGYDTPRSIYGVYGNPAIPAWRAVMSAIHEGLPAKTFEKPEGYRQNGATFINNGEIADGPIPGEETDEETDDETLEEGTEDTEGTNEGETTEGSDPEVNPDGGESSSPSSTGDVPATSPGETTPPPTTTPSPGISDAPVTIF